MASNSSVVAEHYNSLEEQGLAARQLSRIYYLRNFNNWIKSCLINEYVDKIRRREPNAPIVVLDLACGKGGDLLKWQKAGVDKVVFVDIAEQSVKQCQQRYADLRSRSGRRLFDAEFYTADCTRDLLVELLRDKSTRFDLVSVQFAFHYSFESCEQAQTMLKNITSNLRKGGFFIGTTPDAFDIVHRLRKANLSKSSKTITDSFGNSVFSIQFASKTMASITRCADGEPNEKSNDESGNKTQSRAPTDQENGVDEERKALRYELLPLFGAQYRFFLEGVVDCPEYLVHFPTLTKLAAHYGLTMVARQRFANYFTQFQEQQRRLLEIMKALATFPGPETTDEEGNAKPGFEQAQNFVENHRNSEVDEKHSFNRHILVGTISQDEWEALTLYLVFAFLKTDE